jgi:hypothetical protein
MEPECSSPLVQEPATCPTPEPDHFGTLSNEISWSRELISFHLLLGFPSGLFPFGFRTQTLYALIDSPIRSTPLSIIFLLISSARWYVMKSAYHDVPLTSNLLLKKSEVIHDWFSGPKHGKSWCWPGCSYGRLRSGQSLSTTPACYVCAKPDLECPRGGQPGTYTHVATSKATNLERRGTGGNVSSGRPETGADT